MEVLFWGIVIRLLWFAVLWVWEKGRMILPFIPKARKAYWNLLANEKRISWAIAEEDVENFERDLRVLYPALERYGIRMPIIDSVWGEEWREFHLGFLKALRRSIGDEKFDLLEWNYSVDRKNSERNTTVIALNDPAAQQFKALYDVIERQARDKRPEPLLPGLKQLNRALAPSPKLDIDYTKLTTTLKQLGITHPRKSAKDEYWYPFLVRLAVLAQDGKLEEARTLWPTQKAVIDRKAQAKAAEEERQSATDSTLKDP